MPNRYQGADLACLAVIAYTVSAMNGGIDSGLVLGHPAIVL